MSIINIESKRDIHHQNQGKNAKFQQNKERYVMHASIPHQPRMKDQSLQVQKSISRPIQNKTRHHLTKPRPTARTQKQHETLCKRKKCGNYLCRCNSSTSPYESWIVSSYLRQRPQSSCQPPSCLWAPFQQEPFPRSSVSFQL